MLHGPSRAAGLGDEDWQVWEAMTALHRAGKTRLVGVSNVNAAQLEELVRGAAVQAGLRAEPLLRANGLGSPNARVLHGTRDRLSGLLAAHRQPPRARRRGRARHRGATRCTVPQVIFAFALAVGMLPLTGTSSAAHLAEDLAAFDVTLDDDDVRAIDTVSG